MPGGDRTGPAGAGPRTGRQLGYCSGYATAGWMNPAPGRGLGLGFRGGHGGGFGRGFGRGFGAGFGRWGRGRAWYGWGGWAAPHGAYGYAPGPATEADERQMLKGEMEALQAEMEALRSQSEQIRKRLEKLGSGEGDQKASSGGK